MFFDVVVIVLRPRTAWISSQPVTLIGRNRYFVNTCRLVPSVWIQYIPDLLLHRKYRVYLAGKGTDKQGFAQPSRHTAHICDIVILSQVLFF